MTPVLKAARRGHGEDQCHGSRARAMKKDKLNFNWKGREGKGRDGREGKGREGKSTVWRHNFRSSGDWQPVRDISIKDIIQAPEHHHISIQVKNLVKLLVQTPHVNLVKGRARAGEILGTLRLRGQSDIVLD
jgi:hypothetical protein